MACIMKDLRIRLGWLLLYFQYIKIYFGQRQLNEDGKMEEVRPGREEGASVGSGNRSDRKLPSIVSHWNLAEYLPASVRQVFVVGRIVVISIRFC